jgi:hypothetical protein
MSSTYEKIATTTVSGGSTSTFTFNSIPGTYTDLRLIFIGNGTSTETALLRFNSDTGTNYSATKLTGSGTSATSARNTNSTWIQLTDGDINGFGTNPTYASADIFSYANSTTNKTCLINKSSDQNGSGAVQVAVGLWRNTVAITSVTVLISGGNFTSGTTATLYGIKAE